MFQDGVYYPYSSDTQGNHSSSGIPSLLNSPLSQHSGKTPVMAPSIATPTIPPFRFRVRRESVDWRRIHAVDIGTVISQLDVDVLQEHVNTVTYCSLEGERCQRCQSPVDQGLIKILQLAQLTVEWLLHCQDFLKVSLQAAEGKLASAGMQQEQLLAHLKKQNESMKEMSAELKNRKKIIRNQQTMFAPRIMSSQKCMFCNKTFLNASFLQSHMQRRHPDESETHVQLNSEEKSPTQALKSEMNNLKEQIVQQQQLLEAKTFENQRLQRHMEENELQLRENENKSLIESLKQEIKSLKDVVQHQHILQAKTVEEEKQQSRDKDMQKELEQFKALELVQMQAIQKLEHQQKQQDKKWESRLEKMNTLHESEKKKLQSELSRVEVAVSEHQGQSQRQLQEMQRRLQEKEQTIRTQREQITNISSNPPTRVVKVPVLVSAPAPAPEPKPKKVVLDLTSISGRKPPEAEKKHRVSIKKNTNKKEIRRHLEQLVMTELESLGVKPDQRKLKTKELKSILINRNSTQHNLAKQMPDFWWHRENINSTLDQKVGLKGKSRNQEHRSLSRSKHSVQVLESRPRSSSLPSRATQGVSEALARQAKTPQPAPRGRTTTQPKTSTPSQKAALRDHTPKTPPFSSFEDSDVEDSDMEEDEPPQLQQGRMQTRINKEEAIQISAKKSNVIQARPLSARHLSSNQLPPGVIQTAVTNIESDDDDLSEVSELQEIDPRQLKNFREQNGNAEKTNFAKDNIVSEMTKTLERQVANPLSKKPFGGVSILPQRKDEVQDFVPSDLETSEDADSYLEDRKGQFQVSHNSANAVRSLDSVSTSVWDTSQGKSRSGLSDGGTGSTLKSSLFSDTCDSEDVNI
ncbi:cilium assembly protein DZIP1 isoform X2 [Entelurus aequoreus]|uniref:cilium assembly protein DZIP1 isoform X2 n=1 Tax=Entelurus aequoreus TaxID=161455 RepID=UPI002B1DEBA5|nr:cilium assembly protein DZIP1 isoform X2 [Entelurus aequoreus]